MPPAGAAGVDKQVADAPGGVAGRDHADGQIHRRTVGIVMVDRHRQRGAQVHLPAVSEHRATSSVDVGVASGGLPRGSRVRLSGGLGLPRRRVRLAGGLGYIPCGARLFGRLGRWRCVGGNRGLVGGFAGRWRRPPGFRRSGRLARRFLRVAGPSSRCGFLGLFGRIGRSRVRGRFRCRRLAPVLRRRGRRLLARDIGVDGRRRASRAVVGGAAPATRRDQDHRKKHGEGPHHPAAKHDLTLPARLRTGGAAPSGRR